MIKLITLALQIMVLKKSFGKATMAAAMPTEYIERTMEKARGYLWFSIGSLIGGIFFLMAIVVAVLGLGLQIEQHGSVSFTGLMVSAAIFFALSIFVFIVSSILLVIQKQKMLERQRAKEREQPPSPASHITPLVEEILKQFLANLASKRRSKDDQDSVAP